MVTWREVRPDGRVVGELEASVFAAALIIDRDGILAEQARAVVRREVPGRAGAEAEAVAVRLPGASGYRAEAVRVAPLPYVFVFAIAPNDLGIDGGVLITVRSARPDWAAADHMLRSLRLLKRNGTVDGGAAAEPDDVGSGELMLPVVASHG